MYEPNRYLKEWYGANYGISYDVALFIIKEDVNIYDAMSSYRGLFNVWGDVEIKSVSFTFGHRWQYLCFYIIFLGFANVVGQLM